jgi:type I restriction-modification system DNA methylase subunit
MYLRRTWRMQKMELDFDRISELITKYNLVKETGELRRYNEEKTKTDFISPLFKALGWNTENRINRNDSVSPEETISKKRVDYGFRINGIPKFYLEAKSLREEDIQNNAKYVLQAIDYAWMKSCSWAILTNFETIAVYNADWKSPYYNGNLFFVLHPNDFLTDNRFKLLSKESFENNELDKEASKYGKKQLKNHIDKQLLQDMIHFREILSKNIKTNNQDKQLSKEDLDESVQRVLDRLIFIRNAEDRELEENKLLSNVRQWSAKGKGELIKEISKVYSYFDDKYNSKLFAKHLCDDLYIDNETLQEVIEGLNHSKDNSYRYDFSIIESDVLGNIYEQYLGNILKTTPKRAKLETSRVHRKEQGIYYTPSYIVDYIVKNTVREYIKTHTAEEIKDIKILDPACGSGSFLIRAYKELENYWKQTTDFAQTTLDSEEFYSKKVEILKNNIFGVDKDPKAIEIAQLNLLLQISESKQRLPILQNNIKVGNSLIDDPNVSDKAFKWEEEFPEIINNGGFDIVIGNPPYGADFDSKSKKFLNVKFEGENTGNSASYFIFKSLSLLRPNGIFAMIVPKQLTYVTSWNETRKLILRNEILQIIDVSEAFGDVELEQVIAIVRKTNKQNDKVMVGFSNKNAFKVWSINPKWFSEERFPLWINDDNESIFEKVISKAVPLSSIAQVNWGGMVAKFLLQTNSKDTIPCIRGRDVQRYRFVINWYIPKSNIIESYYVKGEKLLFQRIVSRFGEKLFSNYRNARIVCTYANDNCYADKTVTLVWNSKLNLLYLEGLFNSKLISWFAHRYLYNRSQLTMEFMYDYARNFPVKVDISSSLMKKVITNVEKITSIMSSFETDNKFSSDRYAESLKLAEKLSIEIDYIIYEIYGLTQKEISVIERDLPYWPFTSF